MSQSVVWGESQSEYPAPSSWHSKWAPGSLELKPNRGFGSGEVEPSAGPAVIVAVGAAVSTVHVDESSPWFPAGSVALTLKVWWPSARPERVKGELQDAKAAPSSRQLSEALESLEVKLNEAF